MQIGPFIVGIVLAGLVATNQSQSQAASFGSRPGQALQTSQPQQDGVKPYSLHIYVVQRNFQGKALVELRITVSSLSDKLLILPDLRGEGYDKRFILKQGARIVPQLRDRPFEPTSGSRIGLGLEPHQTTQERVDLRRLYDFTKGSYEITLVMRDPTTRAEIRSNSVSFEYAGI